jgi:hypothetical protein
MSNLGKAVKIRPRRLRSRLCVEAGHLAKLEQGDAGLRRGTKLTTRVINFSCATGLEISIMLEEK